MQLSGVSSVVAEGDSALPHEQRAAARLTGERVCTTPAAKFMAVL